MKEKKLKKTVIFAIFLIFAVIFAAFFTGCASTKVSSKTQIKDLSYDSLEQEPFYNQCKDDFIEKTLSNGIPVVIKKSMDQKNSGVRILFDREKSSLSMSGIEQLTLSMMMQGSAKHSSLYISSLEYTDQTFFTSQVHSDYLEYGLISTKDKINSMLKIFAETVKQPLMDSGDFSRVTDSFNKRSLEENKKSNLVLLKKLKQKLYEADDYFVPDFYSEESFIRYKDVINYHKGLLNSRKIKIIATGNFTNEEAETLLKTISDLFSSIPQGKKAVKSNKESVDFSSIKNSVFENSTDDKRIHAIGVYNIPEKNSSEYVKYALTSLYTDDILYQQIRVKYGFASAIGTGAITGSPSIGLISIYDINAASDISRTVKTALETIPEEAQVSRKLNQYKRFYVSTVVSSNASAEKTLNQMGESFIYFGDAKKYIEKPFQIYSVKPADIIEMYKNIFTGEIYWAVIK